MQVNSLQSYKAQSSPQRELTESTCLKWLVCNPAIISVTFLCHKVPYLHNDFCYVKEIFFSCKGKKAMCGLPCQHYHTFNTVYNCSWSFGNWTPITVSGVTLQHVLSYWPIRTDWAFLERWALKIQELTNVRICLLPYSRKTVCEP